MSVTNYPVFILSGLSIPLTLLPLWTRPLSQLLSPTWGNLVLNAAASGAEASMLPNYLIILGLSALYLIIAHFLYQRVEYRALQAGTLEQW
jgi:ABC-2 type transport system permease protein